MSAGRSEADFIWRDEDLWTELQYLLFFFLSFFFLFLKGSKHLCNGSACGSVLLVRGQLQIVFHKLINFQKIVLNEFMS